MQTGSRAQLLVANEHLREVLGLKYCDEVGLLSLLLERGILSRVRTIEVEVHVGSSQPLKVSIGANQPKLAELKAEIARSQGTPERLQELHRVLPTTGSEAKDVGDKRDQSQDKQHSRRMLLEDDDVELMAGDMIALVVKEEPLIWRVFDETSVELSADGSIATKLTRTKAISTPHIASNTSKIGSIFAVVDAIDDEDEEESDVTLVTSALELTEGGHYWEVELVSEDTSFCVGISKPNLDPRCNYAHRDCTDGWFIFACNGALFGNGKQHEDIPTNGGYIQGDRIGMLLDLGSGSLCFFKNGMPNGPGYLAGSVQGPVVHAVQFFFSDNSAKLLGR
jgi:hypothetical protein